MGKKSVSGEQLFDIDVSVKRRVSEDDIQSVWDYWVATHHSGRKGPKPQWSSLRRRRIHDAIRDYGLAATLAAIEGCTHSPWHMGQNPNGTRYNDISLILRSPEHIEKFVALSAHKKDIANSTEGW